MDSASLSGCDSLEADHPLARLISQGTHSLSNSELIALLLADDPASAGQMQIAELTRRVLERTRSLGALTRGDLQDFSNVQGMTLGQAARLAVVGEFGRRVERESSARVKMDTPEMVCQLMVQEFRGMSRESVRVLLLDTKYQLLRIEEISLGSLNESVAHPREIFRPAIVHSAYAIILTHNHPSGDPKPSKADQMLTQRASKVGKTLGIEVVDHIIIGAVRADGPAYYSFKEEGKI